MRQKAAAGLVRERDAGGCDGDDNDWRGDGGKEATEELLRVAVHLAEAVAGLHQRIEGRLGPQRLCTHTSLMETSIHTD